MRFIIPVRATLDSEAGIEVRQRFELDDFAQSSAIDRFREMGLPGQP